MVRTSSKMYCLILVICLSGLSMQGDMNPYDFQAPKKSLLSKMKESKASKMFSSLTKNKTKTKSVSDHPSEEGGSLRDFGFSLIRSFETSKSFAEVLFRFLDTSYHNLELNKLTS